MIHARVLVVHAVPAVRALVSHVLETRGCTAIGVEDCGCAAALEALDPPDVIVVDERLIDADPRAFQAMRALYPGAVVVALAAPTRLRSSAAPRGVDCVVEKPPRDELLLRAIHWALELNEPQPADALA